jgi:hypothetical protein
LIAESNLKQREEFGYAVSSDILVGYGRLLMSVFRLRRGVWGWSVASSGRIGSRGISYTETVDRRDQGSTLQSNAQTRVFKRSLQTILLPQAGLQKGDMILAVRDQTIEGVQGCTNLINSAPQHRKVVLPALDHRSVERKPLKSP